MDIGDMPEYMPKRDDAKRQEQESAARLSNVFSTDKFVIREDPKEDAGIDYSIELVGGSYTNRRFNVQLKSQATVKFLKNKKTFSKEIEPKTLLYLLKSQLFGMYIVYIKKTKKYYYELKKDLEKAATKKYGKEWFNKKEIVLPFTKPLNKKAVQEIVAQVTCYTDYLRTIEAGLNIDDLARSFHDPNESRNYNKIEWSLTKLIETFEGLAVIPDHILVKLPPFARSKKSKSYFESNRSTLYTDNDELFNFFAKLSFDGKKIVSSDKTARINQKNLKNILNFFEYNSFHHISPSDDRRFDERVCIHNLYNHKGCDCEKCSYGRMQWDNVVTKLHEPYDQKNSFHWTRRGYMFLELGKIKEAYNLYTQLAEYSAEQNKWVSYILAKTSLVSMLPVVQSPFYNGGTPEMEKEIKKINLHNEIQNLVLSNDIKSEVLLMLQYITSGAYFHGLYVEMDLQFEKAKTSQFADQRGYAVREDYYSQISNAISDITSFSQGNALHPRYFNGFSVSIQKAIEGILMLHGMKNPISEKPAELDNYVIGLCLRYSDPDTLKKLFIRQNVHPIPFRSRHEDGANKTFSHVDNLLNTFKDAERFCRKELKKDNYVPHDRLCKQIKVSGVLLSVSDESDERLNTFAQRLLHLYKKDGGQISEALMTAFQEILSRRPNALNAATLIKCYEILLKAKEHDGYTLLIELPYFIAERSPEYTDANNETKKLIKNHLNKIASGGHEFNTVLAYWQIADGPTRKRIAALVAAALEKRFNSYLCYTACRAKIIPFEPYMQKFIDAIPLSENAIQIRKMTRSEKDFRQTSLTEFIHLAYISKIDLKNPAVQKLHQGIPYYKWLLNLDTEKSFDVYWLLFEPIEDFLLEFKKHPHIIQAVEQFLMRKNLSRLSQLYFKHFAGSPTNPNQNEKRI